MKNNKGLSTIVATLIIILLVLVATGIIWVVVRGVVQGGSEDVEIKAKCLDSGIEATQVRVFSYGAGSGENNTLNVTLSRTGSDEIGGVLLVFTDDLGENSYAVKIPGNIANLATVSKSVEIPISQIANATKLDAYVYFLDKDGNEVPCTTSGHKEF